MVTPRVGLARYARSMRADFLRNKQFTYEFFAAVPLLAFDATGFLAR